MQQEPSGIAVSGLAALIAGASIGQTVYPRQPVSDAAASTVKHAPSIAAVPDDSSGGDERLLCMWEVRSKPQNAGEPSTALRLDYAVAEAVFDGNGNLTWTIQGEAPFPSGSDAEVDPSVAPIIQHQAISGATRFVGAGVSIDDSDFEAFVLRTDSDDEFSLIDHFDTGCPPRYTRLGSAPGEGMVGAPDWVHLLARNVDETCGTEGQILLRTSTNGGGSWSGSWAEVIDDEEDPIIGFPSRPVLVTEDVNSAMFAYMNTEDPEEMFLNVASAEDITGPEYFLVGPDELLNLEPSGDDYFDAAADVLPGNFAIGPFANMDDATAKLVVVAFHDITDAEEVQNDRDFDVYIMIGQRSGVEDPFAWTDRIRVNTDDIEIEQDVLDPRSDQFMPAIVVDSQNVLHIPWYDTRNDLQFPGEDVRSSLYYRRGEIDFGPTLPEIEWDGSEILLDELAFSTVALFDKTSIGNLIDITMTPDELDAIVVYMGSGDIEETEGFGGGIGGGGGEQTVHERIYSIRIEQ